MTEIRKSTRKFKKYMALVDKRWIHFGDKRYQQYKDSTYLKLYEYLNHGDLKRRKNYFTRHSGVSTKREAIDKELKKSHGIVNAKILSHFYLW